MHEVVAPLPVVWVLPLPLEGCIFVLERCELLLLLCKLPLL